MLLDVKNLHAYYDSSHVLKGISLSIQARETIGLLGKNGMGKSTLIRSYWVMYISERAKYISKKKLL
jgi:branched-chain amino acid transport system ATP-binding protein